MSFALKPNIIPAINSVDFEDVVKKLRLVEPYVEWAHLDIADGTFTNNTLWHNARDLVGFATSLKIEVHLMIARPEERLREWLLPIVKRAIVHAETITDADSVMRQCREAKTEPGIAIATDTPWIALQPYVGMVSFFQILAVNPGLAGQRFQEHNYEKIRRVRELSAPSEIEVDGGMTMETAKKCAEAGATTFAAASLIFESGDIGNAIAALRRVARATDVG